MSKKKKIIVLCSMVALLVITGVLNIVLNNTTAPAAGGREQDFRTLFQSYRAERVATRNRNMLYYENIIRNERSSAEAIAHAEQQQSNITAMFELELNLENLIRAIGFSDAFLTMSTTNINVVIREDELDEDEANRVIALVAEETGRHMSQVSVFPLTTTG